MEYYEKTVNNNPNRLYVFEKIIKQQTRGNVLLDPRQRLFNDLNNLIFEKVNLGPKFDFLTTGGPGQEFS